MPHLTKLPMILNSFQKAVLGTYQNGDFAYLADDGVIADPYDLGDTLLTFLLIELSTGEDCDTLEDADGRLRSANKDIKAGLKAIKALRHAIEDKLAERRLEREA